MVPAALCSQYKMSSIGPYASESIYFQQDLPNNYSSHIFLGNLYHSKDGGETFEPLFHHFALGDNYGIGSLATVIFSDIFNEDIIYMKLGRLNWENMPAPFAVSYDGGKNWNFIKEPFGEGKIPGPICQDAEGTLYFILADETFSNFYFFKSKDSGLSWERIEVQKGKKKIESKDVKFMWADPVKPKVLYFVWLGHGSAFLVSEDGGVNWERRENGLPHNSAGNIPFSWTPMCVTQSPTKPYRIYLVNGDAFVGEEQNVMAYSDDRGKNWKTQKMNKDLSQFWNVKVKPGNHNIIYAIGHYPRNSSKCCYGFYKSKDGGKSWKKTGKFIGLKIDWQDIWSISVTPTGRIILHDYWNGIFISDDDGKTFYPNNKWIKGSVISLFKTKEGQIYCGGACWTYRSRFLDFGPENFVICGNWGFTELRNGLVMSIVAYIDMNSVRLISADEITSDWFTSCGNLGLGYAEDTDTIIMAPDVEDLYYVPKNDKFCKTDDLGKTREDLGGIVSEDYLSCAYVIPKRDDSKNILTGGYYFRSVPEGFFGTLWDATEGAIYISEDGGYNWRPSLGDVGSIISLREDKCNPNIVIAGALGFNEKGGVFVSEDFGRTWERRVEGLKGFETDNGTLYSVVVSPVNDGVVYAAVNFNGGIYKSEDWGKHWTKISDNPVIFDEGFIKDFVCFGNEKHKPIKPIVLSITDILPLEDEKESILISTLSDGLFVLQREEK